MSYENTGKETDFIPPNCWGAVGWIAVDAEDESELRKIMKAEFDFMNLKLLDIEEIRIINSPKEIEKRDEHLAENICNWEPGKRWVWGTLRGYYGEGEA